MAFSSKQNSVLADPSSIPSPMFQLASSLAAASKFTYAPTTAALTTPTVPGTAYPSVKRRSVPRKSENGLVHAWLQAMRDSSPTRSRSSQNDSFRKSDIDMVHHRAWTAKHPSALDKADQIIEAANMKRIVVFLDYDGTLSPIVEDPERAFMSDEMRTVVKEIAHFFPTAIITGRSREKVYEFIQLPELYYAGSHGMDIMGPVEGCSGVKAQGERTVDVQGNEVIHFQPASEFTSIMNEVCKLLEDKAKKVTGATVEHNKFCVTVHFRCVKEENWLALAEDVHKVVQSYSNLYLTQGRKTLEVRPSISWNKGKAVEYLLKSLGYGNRNDVFPIYLGDDRTDEDAFKVLKRRKLGLGILVSNVAKDTSATCSLRDPSEVLEFLRHLVKWKRRSLSRFP